MERSGTEVPIAAAPLRRPRAACVSESAIASRGFALGFCLSDTGIFSFEAADLHRSKTSGSCRISLDHFCGFFQPFRYAMEYADESVCVLSGFACRRCRKDVFGLFWMYA